MEGLSPVGLDNVMFSHSVLPAYFNSKISAASGGVNPPAENEDDVDGCDVEVEVATSDDELPAAEGGVA